MPLLLIALLALLTLAALLLPPRWRERRRAQLMRQPFPAAWRRTLRRHVPLVARLSSAQQLRLKQLMQVFLAEKEFIGCGGLTVTSAMRVVIAAQACLPLLGRARGFYPQLRQILVYPDAFVVQRLHPMGAGVQMERRDVLAGESWSQGQVVLSWSDVLAGAAGPGDGRNVVIHEFAHQLDQEKGRANGAPLLGSRAAYARWSGVMQRAFHELQMQLARGEIGLLSDYAATDPAEFFAVASEVYFEQGARMFLQHPDLFALLHDYYKVDTRDW